MKLAKKTVFIEFMDLLNDEEGSVQQAALQSLMEMSDIFDSETRTNILIPQWKKICASNNSKLLYTIAELFGPFLFKSKGTRFLK